MGGPTDSGVVHVQVIADSTDHHLSRIEAHPDLYVEAVGAVDLLSIAAHCCLDSEGSVTGPDGVVFMGNGRSKEGHNTVTQHLVHRPFIPMDPLHHGVQSRV